MWEDTNYCWVVLCKNHWFHMRQNIFFRHRIPLGQTDAVTPLPPLGKHFMVRSDECRKTYTYKPSDVRRVELELPESFKPHPLFQEELVLDDANRTTAQEPPREEPPQKKPPQEEARQEEPRQEKPPQEQRPQDEQLQGEARQQEPPQKRTSPRRTTPRGTNAS